MALRYGIKYIKMADPDQGRRAQRTNEWGKQWAQQISNKYNVQIDPSYFEWDNIIPRLERQFPDILNEMLNHDHQWHKSDQNESRSKIPRNGEPNENSRRRINIWTQMLTPPGPRISQPHIRGRFHHSKDSSHTTPEITFNHHMTLNSQNKLIKWPETMGIHITLSHLEQQIHHMIVVQWLNANIYIFLTHSFVTQIQPEYGPLHNLQLDQSQQRLKLCGYVHVSPLL